MTVTPTSALTLGLDVNYVTNEVLEDDPSLSLQGIGAYARYQMTTPVALGVRYERLDDEGLFGGIDQVLHEVTVDGGIQAGRRLPRARRVPARLVERVVLPGPAWRGGSSRPSEHGAHRRRLGDRQQDRNLVSRGGRRC